MILTSQNLENANAKRLKNGTVAGYARSALDKIYQTDTEKIKTSRRCTGIYQRYMKIYQQMQNPENVARPDSSISTESRLGDYVFRPISSFSWKASFRTDLGRSASKC